MNISRRNFIKLLGVSSLALVLETTTSCQNEQTPPYTKLSYQELSKYFVVECDNETMLVKNKLYEDKFSVIKLEINDDKLIEREIYSDDSKTYEEGIKNFYQAFNINENAPAIPTLTEIFGIKSSYNPYEINCLLESSKNIENQKTKKLI